MDRVADRFMEGDGQRALAARFSDDDWIDWLWARGDRAPERERGRLVEQVCSTSIE
jgi:hypothetical protein